MVRADRGEYDLLNLPPRSIYSAWHYQCHITFMLAKKNTYTRQHLDLYAMWMCTIGIYSLVSWPYNSYGYFSRLAQLGCDVNETPGWTCLFSFSSTIQSESVLVQAAGLLISSNCLCQAALEHCLAGIGFKRQTEVKTLLKSNYCFLASWSPMRVAHRHYCPCATRIRVQQEASGLTLKQLSLSVLVSNQNIIKTF